MKIYLASPFFNELERNNVKRMANVLRERGHEVYVPMEHEIEKISSAKSLDRVSALNKDTFIARIYLALKNEVKTLIEDEFFN